MHPRNNTLWLRRLQTPGQLQLRVYSRSSISRPLPFVTVPCACQVCRDGEISLVVKQSEEQPLVDYLKGGKKE